MSTPHDPPDDRLDAEEQRLARLLRTLPGGAPPPALDAKILAAARDTTAPRRRRPALWGLGTAAAAVLAVGVIWRLQHQPEPPVVLPESPMAFPEPGADRTAAAAEDAAGAERKQRVQAEQADAGAAASTQVDRTVDDARSAESLSSDEAAEAPKAARIAAPAPVERERRREEAPVEAQRGAPGDRPVERDAGAPPPPPPSAAPTAKLRRASPTPVAPSAAEPPPEQEPSIVFEDAAPMDTQAEPAPVAESAPREAMAQPAPAPPTEPPAPTASGSTASAASSDAGVVTSAPAPTQGYATQADAEAQAALPPVHTDEALAPAEWLARIRARVAAGDRAEAIASLRRFRAVHPLIALPDDLEPLLE